MSEVYNQLYGYGGRYLDTLALHREDERLSLESGVNPSHPNLDPERIPPYYSYS